MGDCEVVEAEAAWEAMFGSALVSSFPRIIVMVMVVVVVVMMALVVEDGLGSCLWILLRRNLLRRNFLRRS